MSCCAVYSTATNRYNFYSLFTCFCNSFLSNKIFLQEKNGNILVGGYQPPLIGKRPIYFCFFLMIASLNFHFFASKILMAYFWTHSKSCLISSFQNLGAMIVPSMKYNISEVSLNDYHFVSTLHIKSLNKNDFAQYVCVAKNTIGKSEEMIKIYGNFCISFAWK